MVDYTRLLATAQRLITANGRSVTLVQFDTTLSDSDRPWLGPADARSAPEATLAVDAVFVDPGSAAKLGLDFVVDDLLKRAEQVMILSAGADEDLSPYQEVIDGSTRWKITQTQVLRPADTTVLAFIGVRR